MADAAAFATRLAPILRVSTATIRRHICQIQEIVPIAGHLDGDHAAVIGLSLAALGSDDPAELTAEICACEMEKPIPGWATTLRGALSVAVQSHGSAIHQGLEPPRNGDWRIWISVDPVYGWMTWSGEGTPIVRYVRASSPDEPQEPSPHDERRGVTRITVLDSSILAVLAELAADTLARPRFTVV